MQLFRAISISPENLCAVPLLIDVPGAEGDILAHIWCFHLTKLPHLGGMCPLTVN